MVCAHLGEKGCFAGWHFCSQPIYRTSQVVFSGYCYFISLCLALFFLLPTTAKQAAFFLLPQSTYEDAQTEHRDSRRLAERQQQEKQGCAQLHQVEKVIVCKEVGSKCFGIFGVSEELIIIFSFLGRQE